MKYDYEVLRTETCYQGFFRLDRVHVRHELFAGGWNQGVVRECLERGHAAAVIPYAPDTDQVVMVEQCRIGALGGAPHPWMLEFVAGIIEVGEKAEEVARREALEEAGCVLTDLEPVSVFHLSPGGCSERIHLFCGRVSTDGVGGVHGLAEEGEDILVHVLPFEQAYAQLEAGRVTSAWSIIGLQWLALNRERLKAQWLGNDASG
ncbi:MAG: ADP-ribose diphosphatase [Gammaproteobacteria bacterium]|nr:MAG: ADP-ribose diphosphatase [Gammaproteobacteria bacterium]